MHEMGTRSVEGRCLGMQAYLYGDSVGLNEKKLCRDAVDV